MKKNEFIESVERLAMWADGFSKEANALVKAFRQKGQQELSPIEKRVLDQRAKRLFRKQK